MYKSTPHFQHQKSDFSSFLVKEKFRPIESSQMFDLLFLGIYWKHGELKKNCRAKCNCVLWSFVELVYITTIHDLSIHEHLKRRFSGPKEHRRASKDHLMKTLPSWKLQIWGALVTKITCTYNLIGPFLVANNKKTIFVQQA